jgi:hypothetical protein
MRNAKGLTLVSVAAVAAGALVLGGGPSLSPLPELARAEAQGNAPVYRPPLRGAPGGRVGGGTRGVVRDVLAVSVVAPDHTGLTASDQPTLYWFISKATAHPVEVTVTSPDETAPIFETQLPGPIEAGVHKIALASHGVRLRPGVSYQWFVAVVPDPNRRSRDILAGGTIEHVAMPEALRAKLAQTPREEHPAIYAEAGFWYDAVTEIYDLVATRPGDAALRKHRAALVAQVGLTEIADIDP